MLTMAFVFYASVLLALWIVYNAYALYLNYLKVSTLGLPVVLCPITPDNPLWIAFQTAFGSVLRFFPFASTSFTRHVRLGWEFHDRYHTHSRLGDAWLMVTPAKNWLYVADPKAITDIFSRGRDFTRPVWMLEPLAVFGPNVGTTEGSDWQRQRKLTAAPFNEQKSALVWSESLRQATDMLSFWCSSSNADGFTTTADDTRTFALHVLAYVGFQKSYPFKSVSREGLVDAKSMTYRDSLAIILENAPFVMLLPVAAFSPSFLPLKWQQIGWAIGSFRDHMKAQLEDERRLMKIGQAGTGTLVSNLVRASEDTAINGSALAKDRAVKPLTEAEILGNIFVFNFAGHDTTAISTAYAMLLLVAHPEVQDWVHEELEYYLKGRELKTLDYNEVFPQLKRCLAVLLETLRLYNPLPGVPKYTGKHATHLEVNNKTYLIPADTLVVPSLQASHTDPRHWGGDSLTWRPQRWIITEASRRDGPKGFEAESLLRPAKGVFFAWSEGVRNCPGKKFAQVEFVALIAALLQRHVAEPVARSNETQEQARMRVSNVVKDSNVTLLLQMRDPHSVRVRWIERA